jgi:hypothetical protein
VIGEPSYTMPSRPKCREARRMAIQSVTYLHNAVVATVIEESEETRPCSIAAGPLEGCSH